MAKETELSLKTSISDVAPVGREDARFAFGENWSRFSAGVTETVIANSVASMRDTLGDLTGKSFLDIGCGSGIHSVAALRLGARRVRGFDYDPASEQCAQALLQRFSPDSTWIIEQGSALDESYLRSLGEFDVVYAWGVLHHTGDLWKALQLVMIPAREKLVLAIYHDQGWQSRAWRSLKRRYVHSGPVGRKALEVLTFFILWGGSLAYYTAKLRPWVTISKWRNYREKRGMSAWTDLVDWAGGYPFEFAKPEAVIDFVTSRGFKLERIRLCGNRPGINEFVFSRQAHGV